ncbi:hypothetical protein [Streptomyces sp. NPDC005533]|uniref:hypothetical protein n=1 Tax=Streptomyces sp. NPDC005533 TaxID=3364723 RepID=UPI0036894CCD
MSSLRRKLEKNLCAGEMRPTTPRIVASLGIIGARGHFPSENAAMKCIYLAVTPLDPTGASRNRSRRDKLLSQEQRDALAALGIHWA